jgi:predicted TIM-barrel fold metal-dependent hydrolase
MRIVALEEHFNAPDLIARIDKSAIRARGWPGPGQPANDRHEAELAEVGPQRLRDMDAAGVSLQVLSAAGPGADLMDSASGPAMARDYNDRLKSMIVDHPDRFAGFAHLPMSAPAAAADELERAVKDLGFRGGLINGVSSGLFLDDPRFEPILTRAEALDVPLYLHPGIPPEAVRRAYYDGLPGATSFILSAPGWGWHAETAVHVLRLVLSGTLDRHPKLKLIIGHMGEGLPAMMARFDNTFTAETEKYLNRTVSRTILDQVWITTSGFFTLPPFMVALMTFGADRILFSVDYPFSPNAAGTRFMNSLPVSPSDRLKIAHGNADALLKLG